MDDNYESNCKDDFKDNHKINANLKILSYNIWFDEHKRTERLFSLFENIKIENPDVVCLQEVLNFQYDTIKDRLNYDYCFPDKLNGTYGCVILSKYPIIKSKIIGLPSRMGRCITLVNININKTMIAIANVHFESEFGEINPTKIEQFRYVSTILNKLYNDYNNVILCSDTNVMQQEEKSFTNIFNKMTDAWMAKGKNPQTEFTYDYFTNLNLQQRNIRLKRRIDKILFRTKNILTLTDFNLIKGSNKTTQPSDHHGISAIFKIS